ncbi:angiopoietin-related protein 4-like [Synchiropus splendidus]|uniref:angiopoietin-related protein 4-like n=1 Tax=Synchiropus splendidus TaxID=270530 RepID=UPI00237DC0BF|nr:angiopoietin-related protein 4-like [Synchiropus splendidus]
MIPQHVLLMLAISIQVTDSFPADVRGTRKYASWDDVNVVAHGLLQLGQGLKEHVDKTNVQMRDINAKLKVFNNTLYALDRGEKEALKVKEWKEAEQMRRQSKEIQAKVTRLEEKVEDMLTEPQLDSDWSKNGGLPSVQRILAAQSRRIDQLVQKIQQQQDKLEKQSMRLHALQGCKEDGEIPPTQRNGFGTLTGELAVWSSMIQKSETIDASGEFWPGQEKIHTLSNQGQSVLQVEVTDWTDQTQVVRYSVQVDGEKKKFALHLQSDSSTGIQTGSTEVPFSTSDRDNDLAAEVNCAQKLSGGWWFSDCGASSLKGKYARRHRSMDQGMFWENSSLTATLLKIGPAAMQQ